ncbi:ABC transporter ATP-binding protein [Sulfitobacter mediterraneus]|uniref:ABC transporter ATP-binding protein n=1 Tax=Sulfitobacter mediterraneus TaxID=83219 RepID=UPI001939EF98|nr:ABC transporter ATP-binding protein [Sulfitobacter mediterraneus]MBM1555402.1 ABC transporter ATP-binding protein [Sulfitobacter mediterraneus]MBM1567045.1 ABC transporter ATP-binding protein [Sulfitobacter mediterraneus]MBM1570847.1 ABC transporter ATP-binding protein [Sulfitobacter mediterraneus]MBM1574647.1 ABC transporter ATP-binding protein [Sulfitobacter mediterraneus]MBM1578360.1 ABC transporter ATP-binding protein [Sulfitobacter mediterraneus]
MNIGNWINPFRAAEGPPPQTLGAFLRWCLSGAWPVLWLAALLSAAAGVMEAGTALILGRVIDATVSAGPEAFFDGRNLALILGAVGFFLILRPILFALSSASNAIMVQPNVNPLVLSRLHRWTLGQNVGFFDDDFAGRIAQKQMQAARAVTDIASELINVVAFALASLLGSLALLVAIDWRMAVGFLVWLVLYFAVINWFLPRVRKRSAGRAGARAMVSGQVVDTITNIKTVKLFAHADHEDRAALGAMQTFRERALEFGYLAAGFRLTLMTLAGLLPVVLLGGTILLWQRGMASEGDIVAAGAVAIRIAQMTGWVSFTLMAIYSNVGEVEDGMKTLTPRVRLEDGPDAKSLDMVQGRIEMRDLGFAYGREAGGVERIDLTIEPGEKLGIVGASGAGKSTLVSLLLRLYDAEQGQILIDDLDVRRATQESLRRNIGMVTQETAMFNRSARDNILYGRPDATEAEVVAAAERAEAHGFIQQLEDHRGRCGYEAHLGERGVKLSGGQRQRIALARAILKDAPILVLDEATSALDSEVEAAIQTALTRVMEGKTVLAIAHRLSTLTEMDRIIVMDQGRIVETGNHEALLAENGLYARYWQRQSGGFLNVKAAE